VDKGMDVLDLDEDFDADTHHRLARAAAAESVVLLKNEGGTLPLAPTSRIAVIGEFARTPRYQGAGSSQVTPTRVDIALDELRAAVPDQVEITFAAGYGINTSDHDEELAAEAVALAEGAEVVVAFLGLPATDESEGFDRSHINLPANQTALLSRLADANPNLVVVLANGSVVAVARSMSSSTLATAVSRTCSSSWPEPTAVMMAASLTPRLGGISRSRPAARAATRSWTAPQSETTRPSKPHSFRRMVVSSQAFWEACTPLTLL